VLLFSPFVGSVISLISVGVDEITASNKNNILSQIYIYIYIYLFTELEE
jgi:hypothetical protein